MRNKRSAGLTGLMGHQWGSKWCPHQAGVSKNTFILNVSPITVTVPMAISRWTFKQILIYSLLNNNYNPFSFNFSLLIFGFYKFQRKHFRKRKSPIGGFMEKKIDSLYSPSTQTICRLSYSHFDSVQSEEKEYIVRYGLSTR